MVGVIVVVVIRHGGRINIHIHVITTHTTARTSQQHVTTGTSISM